MYICNPESRNFGDHDQITATDEHLKAPIKTCWFPHSRSSFWNNFSLNLDNYYKLRHVLPTSYFDLWFYFLLKQVFINQSEPSVQGITRALLSLRSVQSTLKIRHFLTGDYKCSPLQPYQSNPLFSLIRRRGYFDWTIDRQCIDTWTCNARIWLGLGWLE